MIVYMQMSRNFRKRFVYLQSVVSPAIAYLLLLLGPILSFQQMLQAQQNQSSDSPFPSPVLLDAPTELSESEALISYDNPAYLPGSGQLPSSSSLNNLPNNNSPSDNSTSIVRKSIDSPEMQSSQQQLAEASSETSLQTDKLPHRSLKARSLFVRSTQLQSIDYEFAGKYLQEAYLLSLEDRNIEVRKLLQISTEYSGDQTSDYWYLLASAYDQQWEKSRLDWLRKAFELDQWFQVPPLEAALDLVYILDKWGMYQDIINWIQKWKTEISDNKKIQFYLALAYNHSGQREESVELALKNLERFDYDERYFRILLDTPQVSKEMWVNFHFYLENYPPNSPNLLRYLVNKSTDINHTENLLSLYTSLFGDDYFTTAQRILMRQDNLLPRSDIFFNNYKTSDFLVLSQVIRSVSGVRPIGTSMQDLNGLYIMDRDYNGFPEEEITFINGNLTERHIFPSSPNENDIKIRWNSYGEPASYHSFYNHNGSSRTVDILYGRYPFISEITITDHDSRRVYEFSPGRLSYSISNDVPLNSFNWSTTTLRHPMLMESSILNSSRNAKLYETQYRQSDWKLRAKYSMDYLGQLEEIQLDRNLDGTFDEQTSFAQNQRSRTIRDENQNGNFELVIGYENGIPKKYQVDINENGNIDYTETQTEIYSKTWHTYGNSKPAVSSYKYAEDPVDYIYSYYFQWSQQSSSVFAPEYYDNLR